MKVESSVASSADITAPTQDKVRTTSIPRSSGGTIRTEGSNLEHVTPNREVRPRNGDQPSGQVDSANASPLDEPISTANDNVNRQLVEVPKQPVLPTISDEHLSGIEEYRASSIPTKSVSKSVSNTKASGTRSLTELEVQALTPQQKVALHLDHTIPQRRQLESPAVGDNASSTTLGVPATKTSKTEVDEVLHNAFSNASKEAARNATRKHWRKAVVGDAHTESFLARAIIKHSKDRAAILRHILEEYSDEVLDASDDVFLDMAVRQRLSTFSSTELVNMLVSSNRLGYGQEDLAEIDDIQSQMEKVPSRQQLANGIEVQQPSYRAANGAIEDARERQRSIIQEHREKAHAEAQRQKQLVSAAGLSVLSPANDKTGPTSSKYQCSICQKTFTQSGGLTYHTQNQVCLKGAPAPRPIKYKAWCDKCGRGFTTAYAIKMHSEKDGCYKAILLDSPSQLMVQSPDAQPQANGIPSHPVVNPVQVQNTTPQQHMAKPRLHPTRPSPNVTRTPLVSPAPQQPTSVDRSDTPNHRISINSPQIPPPSMSRTQRVQLPMMNAARQPLAPAIYPRYEPLKRKRSSLSSTSTTVVPSDAQQSVQPNGIVVAIPKKRSTASIDLTLDPDESSTLVPDIKVLPEDIDPQKRIEMEAQLAEEAVRLERKIGELDKTSEDFEKLARQYSLTSATRKSQIRKNFGVRLRIRGPNKNSEGRGRGSIKRNGSGAARSSFKPSADESPSGAQHRTEPGEPPLRKRYKVEHRTDGQTSSSPLSDSIRSQSPQQKLKKLSTATRALSQEGTSDIQSQDVVVDERRERSHSPLEVVSSKTDRFAPMNSHSMPNPSKAQTTSMEDSDSSSDSSSDGDIPAKATPGTTPGRTKPRFTRLY